MTIPITAMAVQHCSSFSSTKWFKRGELQTQLAAQAAEAGAIDPVSGPILPLRVADNPALTEDDVSRLSLLGVTGLDAIPVVKPIPLPGERMSDTQLIAEGCRSFRALVILAATVGAMAVLSMVFFLVGA